MGLRRELGSLDRTRVGDAFDGAFDKCASFEETGVMVDVLATDFPALYRMIERLRDRVAEELTDERSRTYAVLGGAMVLVALVEYARAEDMRLEFPDAPEA